MHDDEHPGDDVQDSVAGPDPADIVSGADSQPAAAEVAYSASSRTKYLLMGAIVLLSGVLVYGLTQSGAGATGQSVVAESRSAEAAGECGGGACGDCETGSAEGAPVVAPPFVEEGYQWIDVNVTDERFDPNVIVAAAGMPVTINFGEGSGCMAEVQFYDFPVREDLTSGGAVVELPALEPGEYAFACGNETVYGFLVVQ